MATHWLNGVQRDVDDAYIDLPDGRVVPHVKMGEERDSPQQANFNTRTRRNKQQTQVDDTKPMAKPEMRLFKYLGQQISPSWKRGLEPAREEVRRKTIQILKFTARLKRLTHEQIREILDIEIAGNIGFHGRSLPLRYEDCQAIEGARRETLKSGGYTPACPIYQIYESETAKGMNHTHAYTIAAASLIHQVDKGLSGPQNAPIHAALESSIAEVCYRLGCRGISPLEWHPTHLAHTLDPDDIVQAWLQAKIRANMRGTTTGRDLEHALQAKKWGPAVSFSSL